MCHRRSVDSSRNSYLGIHLGSQRIRAVIVDSELKVTYESVVNYDVDLPEFGTKNGVIKIAGSAEYLCNPVMWVKSLDILIESLATQGADLHSVVAIGGAAQQHGSIYWSDMGLRRLCNLNAIFRLHEQLTDEAFELTRTPTWRDFSTDVQVREMEHAVGGSAEMAAITGSRAHARYTGPQIRKVFRKCPEHYERTSRISLLSSFLASLLIGGMAAIDFTDGSGMNLLDIHTKEWSQICLDACAPDLARRLMKPIASSRLQGRIANYYVQRWNFRPDCMVAACVGSKASEMAGLPGLTDYLMLSLGTSDAILMPLKVAPVMYEGHVLIHPTRPDEFMGLLCFRNGSVPRKTVCRDAANGSWESFNQMLDDTPMGNNGNVAIHFLDREIVPSAQGTLRWDADIDPMTQESLRGLPKFELPETEVRAVIEGQIMHHCAVAREMGFSPHENTKVIVVGSDSSNPRILQIVADVFNTRVYQRSGPEACLLGAVFRARYAFYEHRECACNCRSCRSYDRTSKLSFDEFFKKVPDGLTLAAEPTPGCVQVYQPLIGRCAQMCQVLAANQHDHFVEREE
ncbi:xylulose kinase [Drosophila bipectinata]|uniref:xylulose kinase n=1 Tax=Drosophila bipectinata TaxID=42026 RepID=UPI001C893A9B|nr:xylulose kinase [Drosophila bipectinata]